jgi:hypothetical protein
MLLPTIGWKKGESNLRRFENEIRLLEKSRAALEPWSGKLPAFNRNLRISHKKFLSN